MKLSIKRKKLKREMGFPCWGRFERAGRGGECVVVFQLYSTD